MGFKQLYYRGKQKYQIANIQRKSNKQAQKIAYYKELNKLKRRKAIAKGKAKARAKAKGFNFKKFKSLRI